MCQHAWLMSILLMCFVSKGLVCMKSSTSVVELVMLLCSQVSFFFLIFSLASLCVSLLFFSTSNVPFSALLLLITYFLPTLCGDVQGSGFSLRGSI